MHVHIVFTRKSLCRGKHSKMPSRWRRCFEQLMRIKVIPNLCVNKDKEAKLNLKLETNSLMILMYALTFGHLCWMMHLQQLTVWYGLLTPQIFVAMHFKRLKIIG